MEGLQFGWKPQREAAIFEINSYGRKRENTGCELTDHQLTVGLRIGPPPPNGAGGQHPGRMAVSVWEEVKIMKTEEHVVGVSRRDW